MLSPDCRLICNYRVCSEAAHQNCSRARSWT